tara:strand:- start:28243 stop:28653 length:411 start_codon:yes stop_codon:yes gene_type:complete
MFMQKQNNEPFQKLLKEAYSNNNISALDTIQERYTYGHCMDLAIAFNRIYGFEIQTTLVVEENKLFIGHAWVIREDGFFLDVMGLYSDSTELKSFGDKVITGLNEKDLIQYMDSPPLEKDIQQALILAKQIIKNIS